MYDTALRGIHHQRLMRDLVWLPINKVTRPWSKKPRARRGATRREVDVHRTPPELQRRRNHPDRRPVRVGWRDRGHPAVDRDGERQFTELRRVGRSAMPTSPASPLVQRLPTPRAPRWRDDHGAVARNDDDTKRKFNRTENVRPIPSTDPDFAGLYRRRNDAESINRALDDTLWLRRAHSIGHERQHQPDHLRLGGQQPGVAPPPQAQQ